MNCRVRVMNIQSLYGPRTRDMSPSHTNIHQFEFPESKLIALKIFKA